ncbi:MAG: hypothetical protein ACI9HX_001493 [Pseudoalteromonas tetraodonis]|jgi:hypothetical protein
MAAAEKFDIGVGDELQLETSELLFERLVSALEATNRDNKRLRDERKSLNDQNQSMLRREIELRQQIEAMITRLKLMEQS